MTTDNPRAAWTHDNEAFINAHVGPLTAALAFRVRTSGWDVLGFHFLDNHRHADFNPGSPDLPVTDIALQQLAALPPPAGPLRRMSQRWGQYANDESWRLDGDTVAHTDLHRHNVLIGADARLRARRISIEPLFGQTKYNRHNRRFARRGLEAVQAEWQLLAATSNLRKLHQARLAS